MLDCTALAKLSLKMVDVAYISMLYYKFVANIVKWNTAMCLTNMYHYYYVRI
jgi:hypothetical protein